jgi:hypothetical protein
VRKTAWLVLALRRKRTRKLSPDLLIEEKSEAVTIAHNPLDLLVGDNSAVGPDVGEKSELVAVRRARHSELTGLPRVVTHIRSRAAPVVCDPRFGGPTAFEPQHGMPRSII